MRASTVQRREWQIRAFASALVLPGRDPETLTPLAKLVEIENFKEGLRFFLDKSGGKRTGFIRELGCILTAIARHHLEFDRAQLDPMAVINRRLDIDRHGLTEKNRARLRQFDDPDNIVGLLCLPEKLMRIAARNRNPRAGALQARIATAIGILLMAPIRIGNLSDLDLERDLIRPGRGKQLHIVLAAEQVKGGEPLEYPLPAPSVELIERYLEKFRPLLAHPRCTALFPGKDGGAKASVTLRKQISDTVHLYTGIRMNPHLFRHAMSKIFLDRKPGEESVVQRVLGHKSIDTTTCYYTGLETAAAVRYFDTKILKLRNDGKDKVPMTIILRQDPDRRSKPVEEWPEADQAWWQASLVPGDVLQEGGSRAGYSEHTNRGLVRNYGRWLTWLDRRGQLDRTGSPPDRITPARVRDSLPILSSPTAPTRS